MWKINSNKKVVDKNRDLIFPKIGADASKENVRSVSFTPETLEKLNKLRTKYKLSRSAIIRILIENAGEACE